MLKHIVVWEMKEDVSVEQKAEMRKRLEDLRSTVSELRKIDVGIDDGNGTMSLFSEFASEEDLNVYQAHPDHQDVVAFVKPLVADRTVCDYEY